MRYYEICIKFSDFHFLLNQIYKFSIHLYHSISLTISYSEHDIMESENGNCFYTLGEKIAMFVINQIFPSFEVKTVIILNTCFLLEPLLLLALCKMWKFSISESGTKSSLTTLPLYVHCWWDNQFRPTIIITINPHV